MFSPPPDAHNTMRVAAFYLPGLEGVVEDHRDAGRARVTPFLHDRVRFFLRDLHLLHDHLDRRQIYLRPEKHIDVTERRARLSPRLR